MSELATRKSGKLWWDFRYIWMFISTIWVFFMLSGLFSLWQVTWVPNLDGIGARQISFPAWQRLLGSVLVLAFIAIYIETMYRMYFGRSSWISDATPRERWSMRLPLLLISTVLLFLPWHHPYQDPPFGMSVMFVVIVWTLTAPPDQAFSAVVISTAITSGIQSIAQDPGIAFMTSIYSLAFGFFTSGYVINRGLINELQLERARVRDQAVTEERFRLARDLHDTVGHSMTQITLKAELARRVLHNEPARAADELAQIEELSRALSTQVRRSIAGNVTLSLQQEVERARELLESMEIAVTVSGEQLELSPESSVNLAWCLREGVLNVVKHSGASHCDIAFARNPEFETLTISDNGRQPVVNDSGGQGMTGMRQRVDAQSGTVDLQASATCHVLTIRIPV